MRAGMTPALESRLRRPDPTARLIIEAQAELAGADIRQTSVQWANADSLTGLTVLSDGGVQLSNGVTEVAGNPNGAGTYLPGLGVGNAVGVVNWFGVAEPGNFEVTFLTAYLDPKPNAGQPSTVVKWRCRLYQPFYKDKSNTTAGITLIPLCDAVDVAAGTAAGDVTFDFRPLAQRPRPKLHNDYSAQGSLNGAATFVVIEALDATGKAAANVAWNQDPGNASVAFFNYLATTMTLHANIISTDVNLTLDGLPAVGYPQFAGTGYIKIDTEIIGYTAVRVGGAFTGQLTGLQRGLFGTSAAGHTAGAAVFIGSHNDISSATLAPSLVFPGTLARQATGGGAVRMTVNTGAYSAATLRFSTHPIDLGSAPTTSVELTGLAEVPLGASATFQVLKTGGSVGNPGDWLTFTDGMLTNDPSFGGLLTAAQTYKMQCILAPNAAGSVAPTLRSLGARQVTRTDLTNVAQLKSGAWSFDPISLKSALNDFTLTAIRDGERDYHDRITTLLANNPIGSIIIRLFIGAPDLPRGSWLRLDDLIIDDFAPGGAAIDLVCQTGLSLVKQALPKFNTTASTRQPLSYPSISVPTASLDQIWLDLVNNQLGDVLGSRWVGQGLPAYQLPIPGPTGGTIVANTAANPSVITTSAPHGRTGTFAVKIVGSSDSTINGTWATATVVDATHFSVPVAGAGGTGGTWFYAGGSLTTIIAAKTITDTNTNPTPGRSNAADDAKMELDALAYIAGFVNITSQGKIKAVDVFGAQGVKVTFTPEAIKPTTIAAGLRQRQAEAFVAWGWNGSFYKGEAYGVNAAALAKLGNAYIDPTPLDDTICQWLVQQTGDPANQCGVANALATRIVNAFGTGLILWSFESNYAYPELEPGDLVAVPTDWFVASDPATGNAISGPSYALGIVQSCEPYGRAFTVWVRSYSDILSAAQVGVRSGFATPTVVTGIQRADQNGNVFATINCTGAAAVRVAASSSAFPNATTVGAAGLVTLDATGYVKTGTLITVAYGQTAYVSIIAYENADGSGAASPLYEVQVQAVNQWMNNQGSIPPSTSDASPLSYSGWCVSATSRAGIRWSWSAFTIYRADGSTISVAASSSLPAPSAPTLSQVAGGALALRTRCARVALVKDKMMFGISPESSLSVSANNLLKITSPAAVAGYDGWIPLVGDVNLNNEVVQTGTFPPATPIAFGTDWTEPTGGATLPTGTNTQYNDDATALGAHDWNLTANTTYQYYPCWDVANGRLSFAGGGAMTAKSNLQASRQNRDGYLSLAVSGPISGATPVLGNSSSGSGGGGCLHPDTIVETARGLRKIGELWVGAAIRGRSGRWTRIMKYERRPQRQWIRLTVAGGERLTMTLTHPMTMLAGVKRAAELTLTDLIHVPGGMAEITDLERLTLDGVDQIDIECEPEREFWAGETHPTILTHNTFVQS